MPILSLLVACSVPQTPAPVGDSAEPKGAPSEIEAEPIPATVPLLPATGDTGDAPIAPSLFGDCNAIAPGAETAPNTRLVGTYQPTAETTPFASRVFTDVDGYAQFLANLGIVGAYIDFRSEHAAIFGYGGTDSCGFDLEGWEALDDGGTPALVVRVDDASRGCDTPCDELAPSTIWVLAFPATAEPDTCLVVGGGCGALP